MNLYDHMIYIHNWDFKILFPLFTIILIAKGYL